jgi:hypothetical protein
MSPPFPPESNSLAKIFFVLLLLVIGAAAALATAAVHSPYLNGAGAPVEQPVQFSHQHHVQGLGLDCRYCHTSVEVSSHAGFPDTKTCMTCHSQIWTQASILKPVRDSYTQKKPLRWIQVYQLPDFVYFDHSVHVHGGISCTTCHGRVSQMPAITQARTFFMKDCLECHSHPEKFIGPRENVFTDQNTDQEPAGHQLISGKELMQKYGVHPVPLTNCNGCHR